MASFYEELASNHKEALMESEDNENEDSVGQFPFRMELLMRSLKKCYFEGK